MKNFSVVITLLHVGTGKSDVCTFFIVNTPKLELGPDLESVYKLYNFSVYVYLLHS